MQQRHFDDFSRALASLLNRRQGVSAALALVLATILAEREAAAKKGNKKKRRKRKKKRKKRRKRRGSSGLRNCDNIALEPGADLHRCDLRQHPGLASANFTNARLEDTDLSDTNLENVSFRGAWMWRANLQGANLSGANFSESQERRTDIFEVDFTGATLPGDLTALEDALYYHYAKGL